MTSSTEDCLNSDLFDGKALETLIIASVRTLKRGNKKCGREEVSKLVNDTLCNEICKDIFNETLDSLISMYLRTGLAIAVQLQAVRVSFS